MFAYITSYSTFVDELVTSYTIGSMLTYYVFTNHGKTKTNCHFEFRKNYSMVDQIASLVSIKHFHELLQTAQQFQENADEVD